MKKLLATTFFAVCFCVLFAQNDALQYSRVKVNLLQTELAELSKLGLETDHGVYARNRYFINDFSHKEIERLQANGFEYEILIEDVVAHYKNQNNHLHDHDHDHAQARNPAPCNTIGDVGYDYETPQNYAPGSMGGYLTYSELMVTLDQMRQQFPQLISAKTPVGNLTTEEGRPIHWLRVSDNPDMDEDEPEVLYTALHHAREPNSISQMVFYLWYLLENYETDPEVKYLVDHTEMYFMPCVNPDGYVYNESIEPDGGGLWRKNRATDDMGIPVGVDLNRNYGFGWATDDTGSSPNPTNDTYRGTGPFSEPETQAVRDFSNEHEFVLALNYHTFGNLLIHPWGYNDQVTAEDEAFKAFGRLMTQENNATVGTGTETVGYTVNGNSDDWMYGETTSKPAIFSLTPEVGPQNFGFWPPADAIDELNKSVLKQNLITAHLALNYAELEDQSPALLMTSTGMLDLELAKYGLADGDVTVTVSAGSPNLTINSAPQTFNLQHLDRQPLAIDYQIDVTGISEVIFIATVDNGLYTHSQTFTKTFINGLAETIFVDNAETMNNWDNGGDWAVTTSSFFSAPSSITDSPDGNYASNTESNLTLQTPIDLTGGVLAANLKFRARWETETGWDYAQVMVSTNGVDFEPQCGKFTKIGNEDQDFDQPLYDGAQDAWVLEEINLSDYLGEMIYIRFRLISDGFLNRDGFYFDDLEVEVIKEIPNSVESENTASLSQLKIFPNPVQQQLNLDFSLSKRTASLTVNLLNVIGQVIQTHDFGAKSSGTHQLRLDTKQVAAGLYFLQVVTAEQESVTRKVRRVVSF